MMISANDMLFSCCLVYGSTDWIWVLPVMGHRKERLPQSSAGDLECPTWWLRIVTMSRLAFREAVKLNHKQNTCFRHISMVSRKGNVEIRFKSHFSTQILANPGENKTNWQATPLEEAQALSALQGTAVHRKGSRQVLAVATRWSKRDRRGR